MRISLNLAIFALFAVNHGYAQDPPVYRAEEVVVTATRIPQKITQSLQNVNVITAQEIAESGQQTLVEVLQTRGVVEVTSNGGLGQPSVVRIRGAESKHTLVLIDGLRVDSATLGTTALEHIPLDQVERIEIVPGPLSSLYGSDAIGGVVQVFTKSRKYSPGLSVSAGVGGFNTRTASGGINTRVKDTEFSLNLGYSDSDAFSATKSSVPFGLHNPDDDGYRNRNFSGKLAHHFGSGHEAGLTAFQSEGTTHFDNGLATDDVNRTTINAYSLYSRNQISSVWQSLLRLGRGRDNLIVTGAFPSSTRTDQNQFTWQNDFKLPVGSVIAGIEYLDQKITSTTAYAQTGRTVGSLFAGYQGEYGNHGWQINARQDDNSQFGSHTTGSLGYGYRFNPNFRVRAGAGTAFKAPTFNDLYFPGFSNPNLRPERSHSKEVGLDYQTENHRFGVVYFDNRISDLIVIDPVTFTTLINLDRTRNKGVELAYQGEIGGFQMRANLTLQDPVNQADDKLLPRRAREYGSLSVKKALGSLTLGAELVASGARFDRANETPGTRMHKYELLNLTASYTLAPNWSAHARWDNVFNRDYELVQHFNTPSSNLFVALKYQPK